MSTEDSKDHPSRNPGHGVLGTSHLWNPGKAQAALGVGTGRLGAHRSPDFQLLVGSPVG